MIRKTLSFKKVLEEMYKSHHQHIFASVSCCRSCHCIAQVVCAFSGIINLTMQWWPSLTVSSSLKRRWKRVTQASVFLIGKNVQKINLYKKKCMPLYITRLLEDITVAGANES